MIAKLLMILRKMRELSGIEAFEMTLARQPSQGLIPCLQAIASVLVELPHGLSVINRPQGCHFHPRSHPQP